MRAIALTGLVLIAASSSVLANDQPRQDDRVAVQLPADAKVRLPSPQKPGEMRKAFENADRKSR